MKHLKVGIIIVSFNSENYITDCLKSIFTNTYSDIEVVVVDNSSLDKTIPVIKKNFKKVHTIKNSINLGFGTANNIGIKYLISKKCDYILLINPDAISSTTLVEKLLKPFKINKKIAVAGCIITYANNSKKIWFSGGYFNRLFCFTRHRYKDKLLKNAKIKSGYVDFITGACMMINSKIFKKVGFLPEDYFLYFEDVFFCQKIKAKKFLCYLLNEPLISHHVSTSTGTAQTNIMTPLRAYFFARNPILFINKNVKGYLRLTNLFGQFFIRLPFYSFKCLKDGNVKALIYYCKGILDGVAGKSFNSFLNSD